MNQPATIIAKRPASAAALFKANHRELEQGGQHIGLG
jgi:hypothetical protein